MLVNYIAFVHNLHFHGSSRMRLVECDIQIKISVFITICQTGYQFEVLYTALRTGIEIYIAFNTAIFPVILILQVGTVTITETLTASLFFPAFKNGVILK